MIITNNKYLKIAIAIAIILNCALILNGFYSRTYDSYGHMFFADHWEKSWFSSWDNRWYGGFNVESYAPLAHQLLALTGFVSGLETAYILLTFTMMVILPYAVYRFSKVFVSEDSAGYASLLSIFTPGIFLSVYIWGQFTTLFGLTFTLLTAASFYLYLKKGTWLVFVEFILLFEITIAVHHYTGLFFSPLLLLIILVTVLAKKELNLKTAIKRVSASLLVGLPVAIILIYPILFSAAGQNVNIPHPTTMSYLENPQLFYEFFLEMYGVFLLLMPLTVFVVYKNIRCLPLFILAVFFFIIGFGGTTFLPKLIYGNNWLGLTYDRFALFAVLTILPLLGAVCTKLVQRKNGKKILAAILVPCLVLACAIGNYSFFRPQAAHVPVDSLVNFLSHDEHWRWRYLTLGFEPSDFCKLSMLTNASTLDGWYYRGMNISQLTNAGAGYLSGAKFEETGMATLRYIFENASIFHLRFVFCNDKYYEPLLNETGFTELSQTYDQVTVWAKSDSAPLDNDQIILLNRQPTVMEYAWGILPVSYVIALLSLILFKTYKDKPELFVLFKRKTYSEKSEEQP